jgi:hypothetical protein
MSSNIYVYYHIKHPELSCYFKVLCRDNDNGEDIIEVINKHLDAVMDENTSYTINSEPPTKEQLGDLPLFGYRALVHILAGNILGLDDESGGLD